MSEPVVDDKFENGYFWELYLDLERQFQSFLEYVPYLDGNENAYSFKLLNLLLSIGGHVDSAFKEMARYPRFSNNEDCKHILELLKESEENVKQGKAPKTVPIWLPLSVFEKEYQLSKRKVIFKRLPEREEIIPFQPCDKHTNAPKWWKIYNGLKHDVSLTLKDANLKNTRDALAGAFLLNAYHLPSALRLYEYDIMKVEIRTGSGLTKVKTSVKDIPSKAIKRMLEDLGTCPTFTETSLFLYNYWKKVEK